jgi:hypothetical protein
VSKVTTSITFPILEMYGRPFFNMLCFIACGVTVVLYATRLLIMYFVLCYVIYITALAMKNLQSGTKKGW